MIMAVVVASTIVIILLAWLLAGPHGVPTNVALPVILGIAISVSALLLWFRDRQWDRRRVSGAVRARHQKRLSIVNSWFSIE